MSMLNSKVIYADSESILVPENKSTIQNNLIQTRIKSILVADMVTD